jgi:lysophospholipase L1-like esterase
LSYTLVMRISLFNILVSISVLVLSVFATGYLNPIAAEANIDFQVAVFGDSNSAGFSGIQPWVQKVAPTLNPNTRKLNFVVTNYSIGGTTMADSAGLNSFRNTASFQTFITDPGRKADLAIIMLGTNDALNQISVSNYSAAYRSFLQTLHNSKKVSDVLIVSTPYMMAPYNCIGSTCPVYNSTYNPNINWISKYNSYLATNIATVCNNFNVALKVSRKPMKCKYLNVTSSIPANSSYLNWDGIHLLNSAQTIVANATKAHINTYAVRYILNLATSVKVFNKDTGYAIKSGQFGDYSRFLNAIIYKNATPVAETQLDFRTNLDWIGVNVQSDLVNGKSVAIKLSNVLVGVNWDYALLIPKRDLDTTVRICPAAAGLAYVTATCVNGYNLDPAVATNVSIVNIAGLDYWKVSGLTKASGGMGF